jgi:hypothetical protein
MVFKENRGEKEAIVEVLLKIFWDVTRVRANRLRKGVEGHYADFWLGVKWLAQELRGIF